MASPFLVVSRLSSQKHWFFYWKSYARRRLQTFLSIAAIQLRASRQYWKKQMVLLMLSFQTHLIFSRLTLARCAAVTISVCIF